MGDISENIDKYNLHKKHKTLTALNDLTADMLTNNKLQSIVAELFIKSKKIKVFLDFVIYCFAVAKTIRLSSTHLRNKSANKFQSIICLVLFFNISQSFSKKSLQNHRKKEYKR